MKVLHWWTGTTNWLMKEEEEALCPQSVSDVRVILLISFWFGVAAASLSAAA